MGEVDCVTLVFILEERKLANNALASIFEISAYILNLREC